MWRSYVIVNVNGAYYAGYSIRWTKLRSEAARWSTLRGASKAANALIETAYVKAIVPKLRSQPAKPEGEP